MQCEGHGVSRKEYLDFLGGGLHFSKRDFYTHVLTCFSLGKFLAGTNSTQGNRGLI